VQSACCSGAVPALDVSPFRGAAGLVVHADRHNVAIETAEASSGGTTRGTALRRVMASLFHTLPSTRQHWRRLERARRLAYEQPWAHAVLRVLQLADYREAGQIVSEQGRWVPQPTERVNTGRDAQRARALELHWTNVAVARAAALHQDYVRALQHIVANSRGTECLGLYCAQLLDLAGTDNALASAGER
jgi:hypothetical protein